MLKITSDGRKLGLDQRLINPLFPDNPGSKVRLAKASATCWLLIGRSQPQYENT